MRRAYATGTPLASYPTRALNQQRSASGHCQRP